MQQAGGGGGVLEQDERDDDRGRGRGDRAERDDRGLDRGSLHPGGDVRRGGVAGRRLDHRPVGRQAERVRGGHLLDRGRAPRALVAADQAELGRALAVLAGPRRGLPLPRLRPLPLADLLGQVALHDISFPLCGKRGFAEFQT